MADEPENDEMLTIGEAARRLRISVDTLRDWADNKKFITAHRTPTRQRRFSAHDVDQLARHGPQTK